MTVMTLNLVEKQPAAMRRIIGKHLAVPRWQDTCDYYNQMMERERLTVCFHAQLKQRHATMRFEEMNDVERERLVCAIDELRDPCKPKARAGEKWVFIPEFNRAVREAFYNRPVEQRDAWLLWMGL